MTTMRDQHQNLRQVGVVDALRSCQLFAGLPSSDLESIAALVVMKSLDRDDYLFREGDPSHGFYLVRSGAVSVHRVSSNGKEQVLHVFRTGESFAEATLAMERGYPADARAVESSQVLLVQKAGFLALIKRRPEMALRILAAMSIHLRVLVGQLEDMTMRDVETRLANWLVKRCPQPITSNPVTIELKVTKRVLAAELGTVSGTFSRTLAKFRDRQLVQVKGRRILLLNPLALRALLREHLGEIS